jgi:hypothetical protein
VLLGVERLFWDEDAGHGEESGLDGKGLLGKGVEGCISWDEGGRIGHK